MVKKGLKELKKNNDNKQPSSEILIKDSLLKIERFISRNFSQSTSFLRFNIQREKGFLYVRSIFKYQRWLIPLNFVGGMLGIRYTNLYIFLLTKTQIHERTRTEGAKEDEWMSLEWSS